MNRVLARCSLCALFAGSALACADEGSVGGLTASIEFAPLSGRTSRAVELTDGPSTKRSLLRTAEVPEIVDRLQIVALDTNGSTLAETNLYIEPTGDQLPLFRAGGTWTLSGVPAGDDRRLAGRAYLGANTDPRLDGALVYTGQIDGITVTAGQTTDAGVLLLSPGPIRVPEADEQQPPPPARPEAVVRPEGGALDVSWQAPDATDVAGYVVAVATMPTDDEAPTIARETILQVGDRLPEASAYGVVAIIDANAPRAISLDGLPNGVAIAVLLFAYDTTVDGAPLNYSPPALVFGTPQDTIAPGPVVGLTAERLDDGFAITFTAPGEDGPNDADGTPARYEVRTSSAADLLMDAAGFERAQGVRSPPVAMPGESVRFTRSAQDVGVNVGQDRYVGVRAVDADANTGPIRVATLTVPNVRPPEVVRLRPKVAFAGGELGIEGRAFGASAGTVTVQGTQSATLTQTLRILNWTDRELLVVVPAETTTGILTIRTANGATVQTPIPVLVRRDDIVPPGRPPFGFVADGPVQSLTVLYRENGFGIVEAAIERFIDGTAEGTAWVPTTANERADQVVATRNQDRAIFASRNEEGRLDVALVNTATTVSADPFRQTVDLGPVPPDSIGIAALPTVDDTVPALLAMTLQGTLRTAEVTDARLDAFNLFVPVTSTVVAFDAADVAVAANGSALIVHRTRTGTTARLTLRASTDGAADTFALVDRLGPTAGPHVLVRAIPGQPDRFVIAYEHIGPDGRARIRLVRDDRFGSELGVAVFPEMGLDLEDIGFADLQGRMRILVAAVRITTDTELHYAEVPLDALTDGSTESTGPSSVLDVAPDDVRPRFGCGFDRAVICSLAWRGNSVGTVFIRR